MSTLLLIGLQWGDEGKGKIVDAIAEESDVVMRYQGGANSGHTLKQKDETIVLHHLPSGIFHPTVANVMSWGMVLSPKVLIEELDTVERIVGRKIGPEHLAISGHTSIVLPLHCRLEERRESRRKIGTTRRGIGPAYEDRIGRCAVRVADVMALSEKALKARLEALYEDHDLEISADQRELNEEIAETVRVCKSFVDRIAPYVTRVSRLMATAVREHKKILFEGAQGAMLDVQQGTYPYVTGSMTGHAGVHAAMGIYLPIDARVGVAKVYCTRVGEGPFPSELKNEVGEKIQTDGHEFGATTGRKRRVGWLDLVQLRYSILANGITDVILTKADVLSGYKDIGVVRAYTTDGAELEWLEGGFEMTEEMKPVVQMMPCWKQVTDAQGKISPELEEFCVLIEKYTGARVSVISYGPKRKDVIFRGRKSFQDFYQ